MDAIVCGKQLPANSGSTHRLTAVAKTWKNDLAVTHYIYPRRRRATEDVLVSLAVRLVVV